MILAASAILHVAVQAALIVRVLLRKHRDPAARIAWVIVILAVPLVGIAAYLFRAQGTSWWLSGLAGTLVGSVWNYAMASAFTWRRT